MRALIAALVLSGCSVPAVAPGEDCFIFMIDAEGRRTCVADEGAPLPSEVK